MDDDDADYMQGSDDEVCWLFIFIPVEPCPQRTWFSQNYDFEYSDGDEGDESGTVDVENMYYKAKGGFIWVIGR